MARYTASQRLRNWLTDTASMFTELDRAIESKQALMRAVQPVLDDMLQTAKNSYLPNGNGFTLDQQWKASDPHQYGIYVDLKKALADARGG